jgi:hypothetical protein
LWNHVIIIGLASIALGFPLVPAASARQTAPAGKGKKSSTAKPAESQTSLRMTPGIICRSIDGYEDYEPLPGAAQTSEEKLLVYFRPLGYQTERVDGFYQAHLVPDIQIRKRGAKAIVRQKLRVFDYKPRSAQPPQLLYMKGIISLKELPPGEYDLVVILHDEIAKGPPATQVVKFRIIPAIDPRKKERSEAQAPGFASSCSAAFSSKGSGEFLPAMSCGTAFDGAAAFK